MSLWDDLGVDVETSFRRHHKVAPSLKEVYVKVGLGDERVREIEVTFQPDEALAVATAMLDAVAQLADSADVQLERRYARELKAATDA